MKKLALLTLLLLVTIIPLRYAQTDTLQNNSMSLSIFGWHPFGSGTAPKKVSAPPKPQYITPQGQPTSQSGLGGGLASTANYLNPATAPSYIQPLSTVDSSGLSTGYYPGYGDTTSSGGYNYGSTAVAAPDTSALQNSVKSRIQAIQNAYNSLQGTINPVIQDKVNQYLQNYNTQQQGLNDAFGQTTGQTQAMFGARGLGDSSFQGNALDEAGKTYNQNLDALNQDKSQKLGAIGQYAKGLTSQAQSAADQYNAYLPNLGQYSADQLSSLDTSLAGALPGIQSQIAGMGTNQSFLDALNQYAPQANQGASQLAAQLKTLATSQAPLFAKKQIAQGLVKSSQLQDPNAQSYYQDYFQKLLSGQAV